MAAKTITLPERGELDRAYADRTLSHADYFKACAQIAPRDDVRFFLRVTNARIPYRLKIEAEDLLYQLESRTAKPADRQHINSIRDRYRMSLGSLIVHAAPAVMGYCTCGAELSHPIVEHRAGCAHTEAA